MRAHALIMLNIRNTQIAPIIPITRFLVMRRWLFIWTCFCCVLLSAQERSTLFRVYASSEELPVYALPVDRVEYGKHHVEKAAMAIVVAEGEVTLQITSRTPISEVRIRPEVETLRWTQTNDSTLSLSIAEACNLSVEINNDLYHNLHLFVEQPYAAPRVVKRRSERQQTIVFAPGFRRIDTVRVQSGQTVYIPEGAWLEGTIVVGDAEDVRIYGNGVVRPRGRGYGVEIANSRRVCVQGITTTQVPTGGSDSVLIEDVRCLTHYGWGDGLNVFASSNVQIRRCFCRTSDDCHTVYATRMGYVGSARNIVVEDCTFWADVAHPIMIGLHGAASYKKDMADRNLPYTQDPDEVIRRTDTIEHLVYRNIRILEHAERQVDYQGAMAIVCGDNNVVRDVLFENIQVDSIRCGQLLHLRIAHNEKYCATPGKAIEDIRFRNVYYHAAHTPLSIIEGYSPNRKVQGVTFENLVINGEKIYDAMPTKPKWYKTADFANFFIGNHVKNIVFQ